VFWFVDGLGLGSALVGGFGSALSSGLAFMFMRTAAWRAIISQIYLRIKHHTPLRLGHFLEDARARHLLRTVGPIYQFRHATLQDLLAPPHPASTSFVGTN
jgi:hypothetical protein